jgi:hypothetical protein
MPKKIDPILQKILEHYTPEQLAAPDDKYGTVGNRLRAVYEEPPKKAEKEFLEEVEQQRNEVTKQASVPRGG